MQTNNKLREALTKILNLTNSLDEDCAVDPVEIRDIAKAALAEPVKNCDRFADETDAQIAFLREVWLIGVRNLDRDPFDGWTNEMKYAYSKWLFAPETDKEVEN